MSTYVNNYKLVKYDYMELKINIEYCQDLSTRHFFKHLMLTKSQTQKERKERQMIKK